MKSEETKKTGEYRQGNDQEVSTLNIESWERFCFSGRKNLGMLTGCRREDFV
jgi:hypothetical protein